MLTCISTFFISDPDLLWKKEVVETVESVETGWTVDLRLWMLVASMGLVSLEGVLKGWMVRKLISPFMGMVVGVDG